MNKSIIIHQVCGGSGGLGDFIRAGLSFYSFSRKHELEYFIDLSGYKYLNLCFDLEIIPENIKKIPSEKIWLMNITGKIQNNTLQKIIDEPKVYYLISNAIGFEENSDVNTYIDDFFNIKLKPSARVLDYIENMYKHLGIIENKYVSFHTRCGDKIMCLNNDEQLNKTHILVNIDDVNIYDKYTKFINDFIAKYNVTYPIIIHSDSKIFKNKLRENNNNLMVIDNEIRHNSENIGIDTIESNVQSVGELYIIAKSFCIFSNTYSGFSHMASLIHKKRFYTSIAHHGYYNFLNCKNITSI